MANLPTPTYTQFSKEKCPISIFLKITFNFFYKFIEIFFFFFFFFCEPPILEKKKKKKKKKKKGNLSRDGESGFSSLDAKATRVNFQEPQVLSQNLLYTSLALCMYLSHYTYFFLAQFLAPCTDDFCSIYIYFFTARLLKNFFYVDIIISSFHFVTS